MQRYWIRLAAASAACALAVALTSFVVDGTAGANVNRGLLTTADTVHSQAPQTAAPDASPTQPTGCDPGYFCAYKTGNGGNFCFQTTGSPNWPAGCALKIDSVYDNNATKGVYIYWGYTHTGAYYFLCAECYLLSMATNHFNQCPTGGTTCAGYHKPMQDNAASSRFQ